MSSTHIDPDVAKKALRDALVLDLSVPPSVVDVTLAAYEAAVLAGAWLRARRIQEELHVQAGGAERGSRKSRLLNAKAAGAADVALYLKDAAEKSHARAEAAHD